MNITGKIRILYSFILTGIVVIGFVNYTNRNAWGDEEDIPLKLVAEHPQEIYPRVPVMVKFSVINMGEEKLTLTRIPDDSLSKRLIRIRIKRTTGEIIYEGGIETAQALIEPTYRQAILAPGEKISFVSNLSYIWGKLPPEPLFNDTGKYNVEFWYPESYLIGEHEEVGHYELYLLQRKGTRIRVHSDEIQLRVILPEEYELAFVSAKDIDIPLLIDIDNLARKEEDEITRIDRQMSAFLTDHSDSPWAPLAWLARAHIAGRREDFQNQLDYAERAVETAETHEIDYTRRRALELKEHALRQLGQTERAREIGRQLQAEERERRGLEPIPAPDPDDDHNKAMWEFEKFCDRLEDEGYDPRGLREVAPVAWEEYHRIEEVLWAKYLNQELKAGEFYRQRGAALERITREHTEPIPQEELRERIRRRTEERERRTREASERFNRWREENPEEFEEMLRRMDEEARRHRQPDNEDDRKPE